MSRIVHFEIPADDPQRATRFYQNVFGWEFTKWDGPQEYWLIKTGEETERGIDGGMMPRNGATGPTNTIDVASVDACLEAIQAQGGTVVAGKMPIPGIGYFAACQDTEGNPFSIMETDPSVQG